MKPNRNEALKVLVPVKSSMMKMLGYAPEIIPEGKEKPAFMSGTLYIQYRAGDVRAYTDIPEDVWLERFNFESIGTWYNTRIKDQFKRSVNVDMTV